MTWPWQEPYNAALLEKDPGKLPERLITAEKAILQRLLEMPDAADELPEARALREALDCLYALSPREHPTPGELADQDDDTRGGELDATRYVGWSGRNPVVGVGHSQKQGRE